MLSSALTLGALLGLVAEAGTGVRPRAGVLPRTRGGMERMSGGDAEIEDSLIILRGMGLRELRRRGGTDELNGGRLAEERGGGVREGEVCGGVVCGGDVRGGGVCRNGLCGGGVCGAKARAGGAC